MSYPLLAPDHSNSISAGEFKEAMRLLAGGVAIITAGRGELVSGMTVSSLVSLTVDPPTVMVSINSNASSWPLIEREGIFGANILAADHVALAERFSGRRGVSGPRRFERDQWTTLATGAPILRNALAALDCEVERIVAHRSHLIVIGRVLQSRVAADGGGLTYWNGKYAGTAGGEDVKRWAEVGCPSSRGLSEI